MLCVDEKGRVCQDRYQQIASQLFGLGKSKKTKRRNAANEAAARASGFNSFKEALQARKVAGQWVQGPNAVAPPSATAPGAAVVPTPETSLSPTTGPGVVNTTPAAPPGSSPLPMMPTPSAGTPSYSYGPPSAVDASYYDSQAQADARSEMDQAARNEDADPGEMPEAPRRRGRRGMRTVTADEMMRADDVDDSGYGMDMQEGMGTYIFTGASPRTMTVTQYEHSWADAFKGTQDYLPWGETRPFGGARRIEHRKRPVYSPEEQMAREAVDVENATEKDPFGLGRFKPRPPGAPPGRRKKHHGKKKSRGRLPGHLRLSIQLKENNLPFDSSRLSGIRGAGDGYSLVTPRDGSENLGDIAFNKTDLWVAAGGLVISSFSDFFPRPWKTLANLGGLGLAILSALNFAKSLSLSTIDTSAPVPTPDMQRVTATIQDPSPNGRATKSSMWSSFFGSAGRDRTYNVTFSIDNPTDKELTVPVIIQSKEFPPLSKEVPSVSTRWDITIKPHETVKASRDQVISSSLMTVGDVSATVQLFVGTKPISSAVAFTI